MSAVIVSIKTPKSISAQRYRVYTLINYLITNCIITSCCYTIKLAITRVLHIANEVISNLHDQTIISLTKTRLDQWFPRVSIIIYSIMICFHIIYRLKMYSRNSVYFVNKRTSHSHDRHSSLRPKRLDQSAHSKARVTRGPESGLRFFGCAGSLSGTFSRYCTQSQNRIDENT